LLDVTNNALIQNFLVNSDNELTTATNGGTLTVVGTTTSAATNVTVNSTAASRYGDATFAATGLPLTASYTAVASDSYGRWATNTVTVNLATNITFQYDANGNLTSDGLRSVAYDDENQLIQVWVPGQWSSVFSYDGKMRRRIRQEYTWTNSAWVQTNAVYYVYDGNLVIQERDINNLPTTTYTRGKDLSGSLEGAGALAGCWPEQRNRTWTHRWPATVSIMRTGTATSRCSSTGNKPSLPSICMMPLGTFSQPQACWPMPTFTNFRAKKSI
jgi:hypothetical protein